MSQDRPFQDPLAGPIGGPLSGAPVDGSGRLPSRPPAGRPADPPAYPPVSPRHEPVQQPGWPPQSSGGPVMGQGFAPPGYPPSPSSQPDPMRFGGVPQSAGTVEKRSVRGMIIAAVVAFLVAFVVGVGLVAATGGDSREAELLTAADLYADDEWEVSVNGKEAHADKIAAWDHEDCSDIGDAEVTAIVVGSGCEFGVEAAYERTDLGVTVVQRVFVLSDNVAAEAAADEIELAGLVGSFAYRQALSEGQVQGKAGSSGRFLVVTNAVLAERDGSVGEDALRVFEFRHAESLAILAWK